ncbi:MAG: hypothetical protein ABI679_11525 [Gemmatimonadota bacterium]
MGARTVLPAEVSNFLVQFSIYLHQQAAYPANHPILTSSASAAAMRLSSLMLDRESFAIGVASDRLIIDGASTDPNHAVLRELAEQLHRQQLGVVRFWRGVGAHELEDLVAAMSAARLADRPLGLTRDRDQRRWAHIQLERHAYEQLMLAGEGKPRGSVGAGTSARLNTNPAVQLWMALAASALASDVTDMAGASVQHVAHAIEARKDDIEYDRVIVEYLLQLGRETGRSAAGDAKEVNVQLQELLRTVSPQTLRQLLQLGASLDQRREMVQMATSDLPVSTVLLILNATAAESGQSISHTLLRILNKLALQADTGPAQVRPAAEAAVRDSVRRLLDQWSLKDPNPTSHTGVLDRLARSTNPVDATAQAPESPALRIVQMSLEVEVPGPMLDHAIDTMIAAGEVSALLDLLRGSPDSAASVAAWDHLATPQALEHLLMAEEVESGAVESLISRLGPRAAIPMLDALSQASSRTVRRRLMTWLRHLGPEIGPLVVGRLPDAAWYLQRNLLGLLGSMPSLPPDFSVMPYASHGDARVRREALKILFRKPEYYEETIIRAIKDEDPQIVALGLTMAQEQFPPAAGASILATINRRDWPIELRVQAIRVLSFSTSPQVGRWLVEQSLGRRRLFRQKKLAPKTPELLAILSVLAATWSHDTSAAASLALARKSRDEMIRIAALPPVKP